jgi:hypothetical protein
MTLFLNQETNQFTRGILLNAVVTSVVMKARDAFRLDVKFHAGGNPLALAADSLLVFVVKGGVASASPTLALVTDWEMVGPGHYRGALNCNTVGLVTALGDLPALMAVGELTWSEDGGVGWESSNTLVVRLENDVYKGSEGPPQQMPSALEWLAAQLKTLNGESLVGTGNLVFSGGGVAATWGSIVGDIEQQTDLANFLIDFDNAIFGKMDKSANLSDLGSLTAAKTNLGLKAMAFQDGVGANTLTGTTLPVGVTFSSLTSLGTISSGEWKGTVIADAYISSASSWNAKQAPLVSGTNIKTVNNQSLLGNGNITISGGGGVWGQITGTLADQLDLMGAIGQRGALAGVNVWTGSNSFGPEVFLGRGVLDASPVQAGLSFMDFTSSFSGMLTIPPLTSTRQWKLKNQSGFIAMGNDFTDAERDKLSGLSSAGNIDGGSPSTNFGSTTGINGGAP